MEKEYRLPKEFAEKWIAALRSEEYAQINGYLCNGEGYCCLGVACAILGADSNRMESNEMINPDYYSLEQLNILDNFPEELMETNLMDVLIMMNDIKNKTFIQIADWIEENCLLYEQEKV